MRRVRQAQSEDCSQYGSHRDGSRFYSTLGYTERSTGRQEGPEDKAQYYEREVTLDLWKMTKVCCGTKEGCVCLTPRSWGIRYFERLTILLIPFIQGGIRCTMITKATYW
jgi:hypothetical protein